MIPENFNILFKSLVIIISSIIAIGLGVLTLSGKVSYKLTFFKMIFLKRTLLDHFDFTEVIPAQHNFI